MYYEQLALSDPEFQSTPSARRATRQASGSQVHF